MVDVDNIDQHSRMSDKSLVILGFGMGLGLGVFIGWMARRGVVSKKLKSPSTDLGATSSSCGTMAENGEFKMVLVVRNDLKMGKGKAAAQCAHAAVMAYETLQKKNPKALKEWRYTGQPKVVVKTEGEEALLEMAHNASRRGLGVSLVQDAGRTQIAPGSKTVLAVGPGPKDLVDEVTGHLKLY